VSSSRSTRCARVTNTEFAVNNKVYRVKDFVFIKWVTRKIAVAKIVALRKNEEKSALVRSDNIFSEYVINTDSGSMDVLAS
jgi:hypothetical protein